MSKPGRVIGPEEESLSFSGSTANGVLTYGGANQIDVESNFTISGTTLANVGGAVSVVAAGNLDLFGAPTVTVSSGRLDISGTTAAQGQLYFYEDTDNGTNAVRLLGPASTSGASITLPDATGTVQLKDNVNPGKQYETYFQSFGDDISTTKHYLPFKDINEQTTIYQEEAAMVAPADGRIVSVTIRHSTLEGSGNRTIGIHTIGPNTSQFTTGNWTEEETETLALTSTDDNHVLHFAFSNAKHFESGELVSLSIQDDADLTTGFRYTYVTTIIEWDYSTWLGSTSLETDVAI
jgi:hypothetical protein